MIIGTGILFVVNEISYTLLIILIGISLSSFLDKMVDIIKVLNIKELSDNRCKYEYNLIKSENRFKTLFSKMEICIAILDITSNNNLRFIECNDFLCKKLGYSNYELKNLNLKDILIEEDYNYIVELNSNRISEDMSIEEYKLKHSIEKAVTRTYYTKKGDLLKIRWTITDGDSKGIAFLVGYLIN